MGEDRNRNVLIIVVVLLVMCCCCIIFGYLSWEFGDEALEFFNIDVEPIF